MARTPDAKSTDKAASDKDAKPAAKAKPKRGKGLFVIVALLVLAGAGGGGAWWWLGRDAGTVQASTPTTRPPVFMNLEPFTVNLLEEGGERYLQTSIVFQVTDEKVAESMKAYLPVIRNRILLLLSGKRPSDLATPAGKAKLVEEVTGAVRESIPGTTAQRGIVQAYLGAFVIQ
jgi:flagellar FliL protein